MTALTRTSVSLIALLLGTCALAAPSTLIVATSPQGSTAADMFRDLGRVCTDASFLRQRQTSGSVENLELLLNNQVSLAFVQLDVLKAREQIDQDARVQNLRQLLPLNFDEIHLIARPAVVKKNLLGKETVSGVRRFTELGGKRLGAWGGSVITAKVLAARGGVNPNIQEFKGREDAMNALAAGQVDAVLAVVGQPADWVKALNPAQFTLIPLDLAAAKVNGFYRPATLRYPALGSNVPTFAVQRILVTRDFKTPEKREALLAYQKCALSKLLTLQETEGYHPKWNDVTFKEAGWPWFK